MHIVLAASAACLLFHQQSQAAPFFFILLPFSPARRQTPVSSRGDDYYFESSNLIRLPLCLLDGAGSHSRSHSAHSHNNTNFQRRRDGACHCSIPLPAFFRPVAPVSNSMPIKRQKSRPGLFKIVPSRRQKMRFKFLTQHNNEWGINALRAGILTATSFVPKPHTKNIFYRAFAYQITRGSEST
jgi:hypothetical protein